MYLAGIRYCRFASGHNIHRKWDMAPELMDSTLVIVSTCLPRLHHQTQRRLRINRIVLTKTSSKWPPAGGSPRPTAWPQQRWSIICPLFCPLQGSSILHPLCIVNQPARLYLYCIYIVDISRYLVLVPSTNIGDNCRYYDIVIKNQQSLLILHPTTLSTVRL